MSAIAIVGASGNVGTQLVGEALRRNHTVTAIARDPSKLGLHAGLELKSTDLRMTRKTGSGACGTRRRYQFSTLRGVNTVNDR